MKLISITYNLVIIVCLLTSAVQACVHTVDADISFPSGDPVDPGSIINLYDASTCDQGCDSSNFTFTWTSSDAPESTWTGSTFSHTFNTAGTYTIGLEVKCHGGPIPKENIPGSASLNVIVNTEPDAELTTDKQSYGRTETVVWDASGSYDDDGDALTYEYETSFAPNGGGDPVTNTVSGGNTFPESYDALGIAYCKVTVSDGIESDFCQYLVYIINAEPTAAVTVSPWFPDSGDPTRIDSVTDATFDGTASSDPDGPDGAVASYAWEQIGGTWSGTGSSTHCDFTAPGDYDFKLTVTDNDGATDEKTFSVTVEDRLPTAVLASNPAGTAYLGSSTPLTWTATGSGGDGTLSYMWDLDEDGNNPPVFETNGGTGSTSTKEHAFTTPGFHTVNVEVADADGDKATATLQIEMKGCSEDSHCGDCQYCDIDSGTGIGECTNINVVSITGLDTSYYLDEVGTVTAVLDHDIPVGGSCTITWAGNSNISDNDLVVDATFDTVTNDGKLQAKTSTQAIWAYSNTFDVGEIMDEGDGDDGQPTDGFDAKGQPIWPKCVGNSMGNDDFFITTNVASFSGLVDVTFESIAAGDWLATAKLFDGPFNGEPDILVPTDPLPDGITTGYRILPSGGIEWQTRKNIVEEQPFTNKIYQGTKSTCYVNGNPANNYWEYEMDGHVRAVGVPEYGDESDWILSGGSGSLTSSGITVNVGGGLAWGLVGVTVSFTWQTSNTLTIENLNAPAGKEIAIKGYSYKADDIAGCAFSKRKRWIDECSTSPIGPWQTDTSVTLTQILGDRVLNGNNGYVYGTRCPSGSGSGSD